MPTPPGLLTSCRKRDPPDSQFRQAFAGNKHPSSVLNISPTSLKTSAQCRDLSKELIRSQYGSRRAPAGRCRARRRNWTRTERAGFLPRSHRPRRGPRPLWPAAGSARCSCATAAAATLSPLPAGSQRTTHRRLRSAIISPGQRPKDSAAFICLDTSWQAQTKRIAPSYRLICQMHSKACPDSKCWLAGLALFQLQRNACSEKTGPVCPFYFAADDEGDLDKKASPKGG